MNQIVTTGIVLTRTDYGEANRILTILTPDQGKIRVIAKGVRKVKSKLAGGIELFSVSHITFIRGRKEIGTLVSTRLDAHFDVIVADLDRTMFGYDVLKKIHKATEDEPGEEYYALLRQTLTALNDGVDLAILEVWFLLRLLTLAGHQPNLYTDAKQQSLSADNSFMFEYDAMAFVPSESGQWSAEHIKLLRLAEKSSPQQLARVGDAPVLSHSLLPLLRTLQTQHIT